MCKHERAEVIITEATFRGGISRAGSNSPELDPASALEEQCKNW